jgi:hypothetical protein
MQGTRDRMLDLTAQAGQQAAEMGDVLSVPAGGVVHFTVKVSAPEGAKVEMLVDGKPWQPRADLTVHGSLAQSFDWTGDGRRHWVRANVRGAAGELLLIGNPIYIDLDGQTTP